MMTKNQIGKGFDELNPKVMDFEDAKNCLIPMGYDIIFYISRFMIIF